DPGYRRIRVAPHPPRRGITSAGARLRTPYGEATTSWRIADGELRLRVTVPVGAVAEVVLPSGAGHGDLEHGVHEFAEPFEVEPDGRPVLTVDTRLGDLVESAEGMRVLTGVVTKYVPDAAGHMESGLRG